MKISRADKDGIVVLQVSGKLMGGPDADAFDQQVKQILGEGRRKILVDLGDVSWVNSTGLGILISNYTTLKNAGGALKLVHTSPRIKQIFTVTKLNTIFESFDDENAARASF